jgi:hypothetical protein
MPSVLVAAQFFKIGWKMVMHGDNTWLKLFPGFFARHDGVSSFFVSLQYTCQHIDFVLCPQIGYNTYLVISNH